MNRVLLLCLLFLWVLPVSAQEVTPEPIPPTASAPPTPSTTIDVQGITLEMFFERIPQGRVALMHITGEGLAGARARFLDKTSEFFPVDGDGYYGFLAVNMDLNPRVYDFSVLAWRGDGTRINIPAQVDVVLGGFIRQDDLSVPPDRAYLIEPQVERVEFARLESLVAAVTEEKMWDGFEYPIDSEITSPFGSFRTFNQTVQARHTGWDLRAPTGTPVKSMSGGRVAFAGLMDIRGNHIIIDHGFGLYSGYSHLSQIHVTRGQSVQRGQIIGVSGNTGRSGGSHLHWEITVNGEWVDSIDFMQMWVP